jgi:hypothetical protein
MAVDGRDLDVWVNGFRSDVGMGRHGTGLFATSAETADGSRTTIVAFRSVQDIDTLIPALRRLTEEQGAP